MRDTRWENVSGWVLPRSKLIISDDPEIQEINKDLFEFRVEFSYDGIYWYVVQLVHKNDLEVAYDNVAYKFILDEMVGYLDRLLDERLRGI
jgi:1,2-phenylacetyl-CoA epoxidase PaaB subunit